MCLSLCKLFSNSATIELYMPLVTQIFQLLARVPLPWMQCVGAGLGWLVWCVSPRYRRTFVANVKASGVPSHLAKPAIAAAGMVVSELP